MVSNVNKFDQELEKLRKLTVEEDLKDLLAHSEIGQIKKLVL